MVKNIQKLSKDLSRVINLLPREDLYTSVANPNYAADYLFEMKVLFSLLDHMTKGGWSGSVENRQGQGNIVLPRKPGLKRNFSYFILENKVTKEKWQVVHGTKIKDPFGELRAPDISLQVGNAGVNPTYRDIKAIWDAKLRGKEDSLTNKRISDSEYQSFAWLRENLRVPRPNSADDPLAGWPQAFEVSALITNGDGPTENDQVLLNNGVSITRHFQNATTPTHPRRQLHKPLRPKKIVRLGGISKIKV
ncbi:hypothetical protein EC604_01815 [Paenibacillus amylolyticus]|jgi:hypothetical protein|uniref:Uncharacterized protein n=2 Tax=Paenibacillus amylolyticus TaxID=1451 RepID=A0A5M9WLZ2_PAEAM|nr:hypothetical protein EC604_01815 [Paenibacillus amylolyticus]